MADTPPTSLTAALDIPPSTDQFTTQLPTDIAFGAVSCGGYVACLMAKYAVRYAAQHETMRTQPDLRSALVQFYRPIIASKPAKIQLREVSVGKAWSILHVETSQSGKVAASADLWLSDFSLPGVSLHTGWHFTTRPVDLSRLEVDGDPDWTSYQPAFHWNGFRRAHSYVRNFIPTSWPTEIKFTEQWILPGWDCLPRGSCAMQKDKDKARWTTEMIQFAIDMSLPVQDNFFPQTKPLPMCSVAATLEFAAAQRQARTQGKQNWRELELDGSREPTSEMIHATLSMSTEVKKNLPPGGVRWLYLRSEVKRVVNGRIDLEIVLCDEAMDLVAISQHMAQIIPVAQKWENSRQDAKI
ncbi:thioesterase-like superfamily-domain-containing protein [Aspergillus bertholletiae]|uniref:Thioesterase-like superfamily-domain-containing protein n=1 Tax=Aspergillus bertholletiae TaxID=1226010 RepID=A0A5N7BKY1_9EURO|nr:thioesterase-like superfamily-domain-containing protein [Aspergillus bertholletiae]